MFFSVVRFLFFDDLGIANGVLGWIDILDVCIHIVARFSVDVFHGRF